MAASGNVPTRGSGAAGGENASSGPSPSQPQLYATSPRLVLLPSVVTGPACRLDERPALPTGSHHSYRHIALLHWPRLDQAALARARNDPRKIARLVARRTAHPFEVILAMLTGKSDED